MNIYYKIYKMVPDSFVTPNPNLAPNCCECNCFSASTILNSAVMVDIWGEPQRTWDSVSHSTTVGSIYPHHEDMLSDASRYMYILIR